MNMEIEYTTTHVWVGKVRYEREEWPADSMHNLGPMKIIWWIPRSDGEYPTRLLKEDENPLLADLWQRLENAYIRHKLNIQPEQP